MGFSVTPGSAARISRSRSARSTSYATPALSRFSARCTPLTGGRAPVPANFSPRSWTGERRKTTFLPAKRRLRLHVYA